MGGKNDNEIEETAEEKELAQIAKEKWDFTQSTLNPLMDKYMAKTDAMNTDEAYGYTAGRVTEATQVRQSQDQQQINQNLNQASIDPGSGRAIQTNTQGETVSASAGGDLGARAGVEQTNQYVKGNQTITAIGLGQQAEAQAGLGEVARYATEEAVNDSYTTFNRNSANMQLLGTAAGIGASSYMNRDTDPMQMETSQQPGYRPGTMPGLPGR